MSIEVSKTVSHAIIGDGGGLNVAKVVAYVVLEPGAEAGAPAPTGGQGYTYAQLMAPPVATTAVALLLTGDMQDDGDDVLLFSGDAAADTLIVGNI